MKILQRNQMTSYVVGTLVWTWSFWVFLIFTTISPQSWLWKALFVTGLSGPLVTSLAMSCHNGGPPETRRLLERLLIWRFSPGWYLLAVGLPPLLMVTAAEFCRQFLHPSPELFHFSLVTLIPTFLWLLIRSGAVNEEFGWRGFLLPRLLQKSNPFAASLILGPIWTVWHWPLWFLAGMPHPHWPFGLFFLMVLPMSFLFTWLYLKTKGSLLFAILLHGSVNTAIKVIPILPPDYASFAPFIVWIGLCWTVAALVFVLERRLWFGRSLAPASPTSLGSELPAKGPLKTQPFPLR